MYNIVILTKYSKKILDIFKSRAPLNYNFRLYNLADSTEKEMIKAAESADFMILHGKIPDNVLKAAKSLRLLQLISVGYDHLNFDIIKNMNFPVATVSGANATGVAEMTLTLILTLYRKITLLDKGIRENKWYNEIIGRDNIDKIFELTGKTVGIIGIGEIGRKLSFMLKGFSVKILGYDVRTPSTIDDGLNILRVNLYDLLKESDIVSIHVPLLATTEGMIGEKELSLMKKNAILINTSRGKVINEDALIKVLKQGRISGAGLDVFEQEPIAENSPLTKIDNVIITPHCAGITYEGWFRRVDNSLLNIEMVLNGNRPLNEIIFQ